MFNVIYVFNRQLVEEAKGMEVDTFRVIAVERPAYGSISLQEYGRYSRMGTFFLRPEKNSNF